MLAARSIIWNTWEIYFWEIFSLSRLGAREGFHTCNNRTEGIPLSCISLPSSESASEKRLLKTSLAAGGTLFPPMQLHVPLLSYIAIKHWTQLFFANFSCGIHCQACQLDIGSKNWNVTLRKILGCLLKCCSPAHIGKDCQIDPRATIIGPTTIGNGVIIGPNVTISAGCIGDHVLLEPNSLIWLGVLGARSSLIANRNIVMNCVMNDSIINTDVRFSIVGNYSFLGD